MVSDRNHRANYPFVRLVLVLVVELACLVQVVLVAPVVLVAVPLVVVQHQVMEFLVLVVLVYCLSHSLVVFQ